LLLPTSKIIEDSLDSAVADLFDARQEVLSLCHFWAISAPPKAGAGLQPAPAECAGQAELWAGPDSLCLMPHTAGCV